MKKKKSPSQLRRETRSRLERKHMEESEATEKVTDKSTMHYQVVSDSEEPKLFKCSKCDLKFKSEKGLKIHTGKAHKSEINFTTEKERCTSSHNNSRSISNEDQGPRSEDEPEISQLVCTMCGDHWGPLTTACSTDSTYVRQVQWKSLCSKCWTKKTQSPVDYRFNI